MIQYKNGHSNQNVGNMNYWPSANVWTEVVMHDFNAGTRDFIGTTLDAVGDTFGQYPNFRHNDWNDDTLWWQFAAIYQFRAYGDSMALSWARASWDFVSRYQVTGTSGNGKNFSWPSQCRSKSNMGGVFWKLTAGDTYVNAITTALYMASSAHLHDLTGEGKYLTAATNARNYIRNHLINGAGLVQDGMNIQSCAITDWVFTYNQGKYIEALAVLYGKTGRTEYLDEAVNIAALSMKQSSFQGSDGVITEGQRTPYSENDDARNFKGIYLRGLAVLYRRAPANHQIRNLIRAYVNVQANALIDLASDNASNPIHYAVPWKGPRNSGNHPWGQLAALDALSVFVHVNN